jgi:succinate dehydrogenase/fumarate reductase flavoprotein subunit
VSQLRSVVTVGNGAAGMMAAIAAAPDTDCTVVTDGPLGRSNSMMAQGGSQLPGLFLAGEIVGGLHKRNRLIGNGITDWLVHGRIAGRAAAAYVRL